MTKQAVKKPDKKELRKFAITISVALGVFGGLVLWRKGQAGLILLAIGVVIFLAGLVWPKSLALLHKAWMALALALGFIMSHIILALVYYVVLTPIGFIMKIVRRDPLELSFDRNAESYWIKRQTGLNDKTSYEKMY
jgi:predicted acyltransferase